MLLLLLPEFWDYRCELPHTAVFFFLSFFFAILGFELRASCLLGRFFYHLSHEPFFVLDIFEIGSSLPPE
jgi:hypothetical protein